MLVHPKDNRSLEDSTGVVYQIPCKDCHRVYVGETGRKFGVRKAEHKQEAVTLQKAHFTRSNKKAETTINKFAISDHVAQENHSIEWKRARFFPKTATYLLNGIGRPFTSSGGKTYNESRHGAIQIISHVHSHSLGP